MTPAERKASGAAQRNGTRCSRCYIAYWRTGRAERTTWKLEHLIEEAEFLFDGGADAETIARRLGLEHASLVRQYKRARDRGLTERQLSYRRTE
jgi:hypothetical protein